MALYVLRRAQGREQLRADARRDPGLALARELFARYRIDPAAIPWPPEDDG